MVFSLFEITLLTPHVPRKPQCIPKSPKVDTLNLEYMFKSLIEIDILITKIDRHDFLSSLVF